MVLKKGLPLETLPQKNLKMKGDGESFPFSENFRSFVFHNLIQVNRDLRYYESTQKREG